MIAIYKISIAIHLPVRISVTEAVRILARCPKLVGIRESPQDSFHPQGTCK